MDISIYSNAMAYMLHWLYKLSIMTCREKMFSVAITSREDGGTSTRHCISVGSSLNFTGHKILPTIGGNMSWNMVTTGPSNAQSMRRKAEERQQNEFGFMEWGNFSQRNVKTVHHTVRVSRLLQWGDIAWTTGWGRTQGCGYKLTDDVC